MDSMFIGTESIRLQPVFSWSFVGAVFKQFKTLSLFIFLFFASGPESGLESGMLVDHCFEPPGTIAWWYELCKLARQFMHVTVLFHISCHTGQFSRWIGQFKEKELLAVTVYNISLVKRNLKLNIPAWHTSCQRDRGFFPSTGSWWWTSRTQTTPCKEYSLQLCLCSKWWEWYSVPISLAPNRSSGTWTLAPNSVQKYIPARGVTGAENQDNKRQGEELKTHCLACLCFTDLNAETYGCLMYPPEKFPGGHNYIPGMAGRIAK